MSSEGSITRHIHELVSGDEQAVEQLWNRYFERMVRCAERCLGPAQSRGADAEDVALSAFYNFCEGAQRGSYPKLKDRDNLWPLLVAITGYKSIDLIRRENRQKRGGTGKADDGSGPARGVRLRTADFDLRNVISQEPTPDRTVETADELRRLLALLDDSGDPDLRKIAVGKLRGDRITDIAESLGCVRRTVERKIRLIVQLWEREFDG